MPFIYPSAAELEGKGKVGSTQCVALIQIYANAPNHRAWKPGAAVIGNKKILPGTAIATFVNGRYPSMPTGNHAALFLRHGVNGFWVMDQWKSAGPPGEDKKPTISSRFIRSQRRKQNQNGSWFRASDNADAYSIIEVD